MMSTADAIVIGGGAVGTSTLYHLTKLGMTDVALLEKGNLASGSTGDSAAIVRQHYSNEVSIRLVKRSIEIMRSFPDEMGVDVFTQSGWCFLVPPEAESSFVENMAQLQRLGVRTWEISVQEAVEQHLPGLNPDGIGPRSLRTGRRVSPTPMRYAKVSPTERAMPAPTCTSTPL